MGTSLCARWATFLFTGAEMQTSFSQMLDMCYQLGIRCVSVYAFSIENFKRPEVEVHALMQLAESSLLELCSSE